MTTAAESPDETEPAVTTSATTTTTTTSTASTTTQTTTSAAKTHPAAPPFNSSNYDFGDFYMLCEEDTVFHKVDDPLFYGKGNHTEVVYYIRHLQEDRR